MVRTGVSEPSSTTTQPSNSLNRQGAFMGTTVVPVGLGEEAAAERGQLSGLREPQLIQLTARGGASPSTSSSIGQLPASSISKTTSEAAAPPAPVIAITRSVLGPPLSATRNPTAKATAPNAAASARARLAGAARRGTDVRRRAAREPRRQIGRRACLDQRLVDTLEPLALGRVEVRADQLVEVRAVVRSFERPVELVGEPRERASRPRLHRPEGYTERVGDLALREAAPVRELDHRPLVLGEDLERPVHLPCAPGGFCAVRGAGVVAGPVGGSAAGSGVRRRPSVMAFRATA